MRNLKSWFFFSVLSSAALFAGRSPQWTRDSAAVAKQFSVAVDFTSPKKVGYQIFKRTNLAGEVSYAITFRGMPDVAAKKLNAVSFDALADEIFVITNKQRDRKPVARCPKRATASVEIDGKKLIPQVLCPELFDATEKAELQRWTQRCLEAPASEN